MHQQIRTSPYGVDVNIRRALDVLARRQVNVEGVGPDYEAPHARLVVPHDAVEDALSALRQAGLDPELRPACTLALANRSGQLSPILERLSAHFEIQSVLLLAGRHRGLTLVSVGLDREPTAEEHKELGCISEI
jgi:hypothetical protein